MSYSRWTDSRWYTFWASYLEEKSKNRDDQWFEICDFGPKLGFSYKQLKEDLDGCVQEVFNFYSKQRSFQIIRDWETKAYEDRVLEPDPPTDKELKELKDYMQSFILDVEEDKTLQ